MLVFDHIKGLVAAPFTPFTPEGELNTKVIPDYYRLLKKNKVIGAFICGSTGEGPSLTLDEKKAVFRAWALATSHDHEFKVIAFLGGTSIPECQLLASYAREQGLYATAFTAPYYFKPADLEALILTCAEVARVAPDLPFYYYHIPVLTGVHFSMFPFLVQLQDRIPNFVGIKYTHEDFMDYMACLNYRNQKYNMLWGRDENYLAACAVGAQGAVGSTYNYAAPLYHHLQDAFDQNNFDQARQWQLTSIEMIKLLGKYGGIATGKAYMKLIGLDCGPCRLPVKNLDQTAWNSFQTDVKTIQFERYCSQ